MTEHLDDGRWRSAVEAELLGQATDDQRDTLEGYEPRGEEHQTEKALLDALRGPPEVDHDDRDRATLQAVLEGFETDDVAQAAQRDSVADRRRAWTPVAVLVTAVAAAAAIVVWITGDDETVTPRPAVSRGDVKAPRTATPLAAMDSHTRARSRRSRARSRSRLHSPDGVELSASDEACAQRDGTSACWDAGTRFVAQPSGELTLLDGRVEVRAGERTTASVKVDDLTVAPTPNSAVVIDRRGRRILGVG